MAAEAVFTLDKIHVNDIGTNLRVTVEDDGAVVDLTGHTALVYKFTKPDSTTLYKSGTAYVAASGIMNYTTVDGDLDQKGIWFLQCYVEIPSGNWHTNKATFTVHETS